MNDIVMEVVRFGIFAVRKLDFGRKTLREFDSNQLNKKLYL